MSVMRSEMPKFPSFRMLKLNKLILIPSNLQCLEITVILCILLCSDICGSIYSRASSDHKKTTLFIYADIFTSYEVQKLCRRYIGFRILFYSGICGSSDFQKTEILHIILIGYKIHSVNFKFLSII